MSVYTTGVQRLIEELGKLPGIGPKSAQRIAFWILKASKEDAERLANAILLARQSTTFCQRCFNFSEGELCGICADSGREPGVLCVVEEPRDVVAIEKSGSFKGRYHVLQGALNLIEGIGPEKLRIKELLDRVGSERITEVIVCTNPNHEGEQTALYLARMLAPLGVKVTRIASGLPVGSDIEYADEVTLGRALEGRRSLT